MTNVYLKYEKIHSRQSVGYLSTSCSFHICPQQASTFLPCICVSSYFWLSASPYISVHLCVVVNVLSMRSKATLLAGAVCTNIGCGGGLRGSQREVARHGPTPVQAGTHIHTHKHTAAKAGSSKSYTPPGEARTHTGAGSQEEGAASASLIKTVAVHLSPLLTVL